MTYKEALEYLVASYTLGSKKGHDNLKRLLDQFGTPQEKLKIIHVAGTNGKGSTCAFVSSVLREAGFSVGVFTSPHLETYNERFSVDGALITDEELAYWVGRVKQCTEEVFSADDYFSFFEILTVVAFNYFLDKQVDYVVLETGLGGRLDATNVIQKPVLTVITRIGFDHMEYLGNTIGDITAEKSEIIKNNCPAVLYFQSEEVYNHVKKVSDSRNARLYYYAEGFQAQVIQESLEQMQFTLRTEFFSYDKVTINMVGKYQLYNAANALLVIHALQDLGVLITHEHIQSGLCNAFIPGRMEIIRRQPTVLLDGAHNIDGATEMKAFLLDYKNKTNAQIIVVLGMLRDKAHREMAKEICAYATRIIVTTPDNKRALSSHALYNEIDMPGRKIVEEPDYKQAYRMAIEGAGQEDLVVCTGSLYLVGDIRNYEKGCGDER